MRRYYDRLAAGMAPPQSVSEAALRVIRANQFQSPEEQLLGSALAFQKMAAQLGVPLSEAFTTIDNMQRRSSVGETPEFLAIDDFIREEIIKSV